MTALHRLTARDIAAGVANHTFSATEVFDAIADHVEQVNPSLNAIIDFDRAAGLAEAAAIDQRADRDARQSLLGVPFTVKDNLWGAGRRSTFGSRLFADFRAERDSWAVARLRARGAAVLGITNCSEFACKGITENPLHGVTRHPLDPTRTPGGSSGGAVASVASGMGPIALGTDAGGSIRRPAAHTGLVGFKPSFGVVPDPWGFRDPNHLLSVVGPIARDVADCALVFDALADTTIAAALDEPIGGGLRVAFAPDFGCGFAVDTDVSRVVQAAVDALRADGVAVAVAHPAWPEGTSEYPLLGLQQSALAALYGEHTAIIDPDIAAQIEIGRRHSGPTIAAALLARDEIRRAFNQFFDRYDVWLTPTAPCEAWTIDAKYPSMIGGRPATPRGHAAFTPIVNYCDAPALSIPCGVGEHGLPIGLQIIGRPRADRTVLRMGAYLERLLTR